LSGPPSLIERLPWSCIEKAQSTIDLGRKKGRKRGQVSTPQKATLKFLQRQRSCCPATKPYVVNTLESKRGTHTKSVSKPPHAQPRWQNTLVIEDNIVRKGAAQSVTTQSRGLRPKEKKEIGSIETRGRERKGKKKKLIHFVRCF
jgi:hypothetical protein